VSALQVMNQVSRCRLSGCV